MKNKTIRPPFHCCVAVVLMTVIPLPAAAQQSRPADQLLEASLYFRKAEEDRDCRPDSAAEWAKKADSRLRGFRSVSPEERDMAAVLKAKTTILRRDLERRKKDQQRVEREIPGLLKKGRVDSSLRMLMSLEDSGCDPQVFRLRAATENRAAEADRLVQRGDALLPSNPREALRHYKAARSVNVEYPDLEYRMESARRNIEGGSVAKGILATVLVGALIGGAVYLGYQQEKKNRAGTGYYR